MAQFVLIDHSLKNVGGHHYDYAFHVLQAARARGYELVLAAHRRFRAASDIPSPCRIFRLFPHDTYSRYAIYESSRSRAIPTHPAAPLRRGRRGAGSRLGDGFRAAWDASRRRRRLRQFARSCQRLFRQVRLREGDHVLLPTVSEFDLAGLVQYLKSDPTSQRADWHLQFHFNIFDGREPDYPRQGERLAKMQSCFREALGEAPDHRLHFYNTTAEMAAQYNLLGAARFQILTYPTHPALQPRRPESPPERPLRIVCAGAIRREKGQQLLERVAGDLWSDLLAPGKAQLQVQSNKSWFHVPLPAASTTHSQSDRDPPSPDSRPRDDLDPNSVSAAPVTYVPHPLGAKEYVDFICNANIGLLLYDSDRYYARRAGILGELLCAGVPVIVPAGCWLAEQIAEPIYRHVDRCRAELPLVRELSGEAVQWRREAGANSGGSSARDRLIFGAGPAAAVADARVAKEARELIIRFRRREPAEPGAFVRLSVEQYGDGDDLLDRSAAVLGRRAGNQRIPALFHLQSNVNRIRVRWENAYHDQPLEASETTLAFLRGEGGSDQPVPSGAVGLAAADPDQVARLVREMAAHYEHYRDTAIEFSEKWRREHDPQRTVDQLLANGRDAPPVSPLAD